MSFAQKVKKEITLIKNEECCKLAELNAMLKNSTIIKADNNYYLEFQTLNPSIARRFYSNVKELYNAEMKLTLKKQINLNKKNIYIITILSKTDIIITEHELEEDNGNLLLEKDCCKTSFLRGAFLSCGSINNPYKEYHLEFQTKSTKIAILIQQILNYFNLNSKIGKRRNSLIVYIKDAEAISDFLKIINTTESMLDFEDIRIRRDYNSSLNRLINCRVANDIKSLDAATNQLKYIKIIEKKIGLKKISPKLVEVIELRKKNPEGSLTDLSNDSFEMGLNLSKSCINHRFRKIKEIVDELK